MMNNFLHHLKNDLIAAPNKDFSLRYISVFQIGDVHFSVSNCRVFIEKVMGSGRPLRDQDGCIYKMSQTDLIVEHHNIKRSVIYPVFIDLYWNFDIAVNCFWDFLMRAVDLQMKYDKHIGEKMLKIALCFRKHFSVQPIFHENENTDILSSLSFDGLTQERWICTKEPKIFVYEIQDTADIDCDFLADFINATFTFQYNFIDAIDSINSFISHAFKRYKLDPSVHDCYTVSDTIENESFWQCMRILSYLFGEIRVPSYSPTLQGGLP